MKIQEGGSKKRPVGCTPMKDVENYLSIEAFEKMIRATKETSQPLRNKLILLFMGKYGRRVSEVLNLRLRDIKWDEDRIAWNLLKKRRGRSRYLQPIDHKIMEKLKDYMRIVRWKYKDEGSKVFSITRRRVGQIVNQCSEISGVKFVGYRPVHCHTFRHTFAIHYLRSNPNLRMLKEELGHSSILITEYYLTFSDKDRREALEKEWQE